MEERKSCRKEMLDKHWDWRLQTTSPLSILCYASLKSGLNFSNFSDVEIAVRLNESRFALELRSDLKESSLLIYTFHQKSGESYYIELM
ncbi:hypothetical protein MUK42_20935 [Musa troglodytarum]|uniref:Uncharacterized protein n=1 Tax=Musa troglodytarum TaxID=320322 RepID=A0A9E7K6Z2_9LILI|nr:hypothetical protein MUK42_20935 [Musa troglodytarum]